MLPEGGGPSVSADRTGVAIGLPGHGQGPRGPGLPHGHPGGGDAAPGPKEQMILRAVCDERISVPVESLQQFTEGLGALAEVKVNWRCNTKQWWGAVPDSVALFIYRKLGYTNDMIKLMALGPWVPDRCRWP